MKILVLHGPNLNTLGQREPAIYGTMTLDEINQRLRRQAEEYGIELTIYQSNSEGALIDCIQQEHDCDGLIINPGALTHYGLSLRDALAMLKIPILEVHLSNIYAREPFRHESVIAPIAMGQICGLGWRSYTVALRTLFEQRVPEK
jgi:3-dehydroquinate dehydratase-2